MLLSTWSWAGGGSSYKQEGDNDDEDCDDGDDDDDEDDADNINGWMGCLHINKMIMGMMINDDDVHRQPNLTSS